MIFIKGLVMSEQLSLFDAMAARDEAIERVEKNAEPVWKEECRSAIRHLAMSKAEITTDDVWEYLADLGVDLPHEVRAIGPMMIRASRDGWITATDRYRNSHRVECHARPIRIWGSLIF